MTMGDFIASGRVIDLILVGVMVEAIALISYRWKTGRGIASQDLIANLLAGVCLMLALRGALAGAGWQWIALCLSGSLLAHLTDLWRRWRP